MAVSDSCSLERVCDLVPHNNMPFCISFMFPVNSKHKFKHCKKKNT